MNNVLGLNSLRGFQCLHVANLAFVHFFEMIGHRLAVAVELNAVADDIAVAQLFKMAGVKRDGIENLNSVTVRKLRPIAVCRDELAVTCYAFDGEFFDVGKTQGARDITVADLAPFAPCVFNRLLSHEVRTAGRVFNL